MAEVSGEFEAVDAELRAIMLAEANGMTVARDLPRDLEMRTPAIDPKTGEPGWFGTVTIKQSCVAYHLVPIRRCSTAAPTRWRSGGRARPVSISRSMMRRCLPNWPR